MTSPLSGGQVEVEVVADATRFDNDLGRRVRSSMQGAQRQAAAGGTRFGSTFGNKAAGSAAAGLKRLAGAAAGVFAGQQLVRGVGSAIQAASSYEEAMNKVTQVFGPARDEIVAFARTTTDALGVSQTQALQAAGTFGNLMTALGVAPKAATAMSKSFVTLGADLASFNDTSPQEALDALRSGLSGETEPLKRYGVALNDAEIRQEALRLGLIKTTKGALTPAAKAQAIYEVVMRQTIKAQGDSARSQDTYAFKMKKAKASINDLKTAVGKNLLPTFTALATKLGETAQGANPLGVGLRKVGFGISAMVASFKDGDVTSDGFVGRMEEIGVMLREKVVPAVRDFATAAKPVIIGMIKAAVPVIGLLFSILGDVARIVKENQTTVGALAAAILGGVVAVRLFTKVSRAMLALNRIVGMYKAWRAGQLALNAAMKANVIGVIVTALAVVAAGFVYAYKNSEDFRIFVNKVIKTVGGGLINLADAWLATLETIAGAAGKLPGPLGAPFRKAEQAIKSARGGLQTFKDKLDGLPTKKEVTLVLTARETAAATAAIAKYDAMGGKAVGIAQRKRRGQPIRAGATGGIVRRPTYALIGEAGPEAVVPLNKAPGASPLPAGFGGRIVQHFHVTEPQDADALQRQAAFRFRTLATVG